MERSGGSPWWTSSSTPLGVIFGATHAVRRGLLSNQYEFSRGISERQAGFGHVMVRAQK
jgi:hypothetical protein